MEAKDFVDELVARARKAQEEYEKFSQEQADAIVRACAKAVYDNAEYLARLAVDETRMGVYEHKIQKNKGKAKVIWNSLKGKKSVGILSRNEETGITEIARRSESSAPSHPAPTRSLPDVQRNVRSQGSQRHHHRTASAFQEHLLRDCTAHERGNCEARRSEEPYTDNRGADRRAVLRAYARG